MALPNYRILTDQPSDLKALVCRGDGSKTRVLPVDSSGVLAIYAAATHTVGATSFDIQDLTSVSDNILVRDQGGTSTDRGVLTGASSALSIQDNGGSLIIDATDLDIRDLTGTSDNILVYGQDSTATNRTVLADTYGNVRNLAQRRAVTDTCEAICTVTDYTGSTARDVSEQIEYSFAVLNSGTNGATVKLEISPNDSDWVADSAEVTLAASDLTVMTAGRFLRYARISAKSQTAGSDTTLIVWFQARV